MMTVTISFVTSDRNGDGINLIICVILH